MTPVKTYNAPSSIHSLTSSTSFSTTTGGVGDGECVVHVSGLIVNDLFPVDNKGLWAPSPYLVLRVGEDSVATPPVEEHGLVARDLAFEFTLPSSGALAYSELQVSLDYKSASRLSNTLGNHAFPLSLSPLSLPFPLSPLPLPFPFPSLLYPLPFPFRPLSLSLSSVSPCIYVWKTVYYCTIILIITNFLLLLYCMTPLIAILLLLTLPLFSGPTPYSLFPIP